MEDASELSKDASPGVCEPTKGEKAPTSVPSSFVFPAFYGTRGTVSPALLWQLLGVCVMMFAYCWLYVGVAWSPLPRLAKLKVALLSCDAGVPTQLAPLLPPALSAAPPLGQQLLTGALFGAASPVAGVLGYYWYSCAAAAGAPSCASAASACRSELVGVVNDGKAWSALYIPPGFTASVLSNAPAFGMNASRPAVEHIYSSGRSYTTYSYINPVMTGAGTVMGVGLASSVLASPQLAAAMRPSFLVQPLTLAATDLHPVSHLGQEFAAYVFCIILWMGAAFFAALAHIFKTPPELRSLVSGSPVGVRDGLHAALRKLLLVVLFCFVLAIALVAVLLCVGNYQAAGTSHGGAQWAHNPGLAIAYGAYLAWSFYAMNALILSLARMHNFTIYTTFFLILQLSSSGGFFSELLSNRFFLIGRGFPFYYGVRAFCTIFFGGQEVWMPINWMVPTVWNAGCYAAHLYIAILWPRRRIPNQSQVADKAPEGAV